VAYARFVALADNCLAVEMWAWCLITNYVDLILVPSDPDGLRRALACMRRHGAGVTQAAAQPGWPFLAWPVRGARHGQGTSCGGAAGFAQGGAGAVDRACPDWRWASARAHVRKDDGITALMPINSRTPPICLPGSRRWVSSIARALPKHRPATRRQPCSRRHRMADRMFPQTGQARAEAGRARGRLMDAHRPAPRIGRWQKFPSSKNLPVYDIRSHISTLHLGNFCRLSGRLFSPSSPFAARF
jgi:hypothetical protein